ncbi:MAG TPA: DUF3106 domain-containing protein [Verrucomicrobiae bacterium]
MSSSSRVIFVLAAGLAFFCTPLLAQPAGASTNKSPVALFRELLAMNPEQRQEAISIRPPDIQKRILEKLNEYELLPGELRELRLRETELRWYLRPLMDEPRTNRAVLLARIPGEVRGQVEERLQLWDLLPPPLQEELKDNDLIASYFAQAPFATPAQLQELLLQIPPERRVELEKGMEAWKGMSEDQRQKALAGFNQFFELTPAQKEKALDLMSDEERSQMEQTLASYEHLTPEQRRQCTSSFEKFVRMNVAERQLFLKNAERWREMTPEDRQKWRELVMVAPIMPQSFPSRPQSSGGSWLRGVKAARTN